MNFTKHLKYKISTAQNPSSYKWKLKACKFPFKLLHLLVCHQYKELYLNNYLEILSTKSMAKPISSLQKKETHSSVNSYA